MASIVQSPRVMSKKLNIQGVLRQEWKAHRSTSNTPFVARPFPALAQGRALVLGHRGASAEAPENTLAAFGEAMRQGADGVELDVRLCASGEVVVAHDPTLARVGGEPLEIAQSSLTRLRGVELGRGRHERFQGERVPTLEEVLRALPEGALVDVELKGEGVVDHRLVRRTLEVIAACGERPIVLTSFHPVLLAAARAMGPRLPAGILFEPPQRVGPRLGLGRLIGAALVGAERSLCTPVSVESWHRQGFAVAAWTVDEPAQIERLCAAGVDVIISNRPAVAVESVRRAAERARQLR